MHLKQHLRLMQHNRIFFLSFLIVSIDYFFFHNADYTEFRNYFEYLQKFPYCPQCGNACSFEITDRIAKRELKKVIIQTPELKEYIIDYIQGVEDEVNYYWLYYDYLNNHNLDYHIILNDEENNIILKNAVADIVKEIKGLKNETNGKRLYSKTQASFV